MAKNGTAQKHADFWGRVIVSLDETARNFRERHPLGQGPYANARQSSLNHDPR